jgi:hypothetical protein
MLRDLKQWRDAVLSPTRADLICIEDEMLLSEMRKDPALESAVLTQIAAWYDILKSVSAPIIDFTCPAPTGLAPEAESPPQDLRSTVDSEVLDGVASQALAITSHQGFHVPLLRKQIELMRVLLSSRVGVVSSIVNRLLQQSNYRITQEDRRCAISNSEIPFTPEVMLRVP